MLRRLAFAPRRAVPRSGRLGSSRGFAAQTLSSFAGGERSRTHDGTSSGALASERLRMARKKALEGMSRASAADDPQRKEIAAAAEATHGASEGKSRALAKERSSLFTAEEKLRTNDGASSGALASERLRMARRKALEGISEALATDSPQQTDTAAVVETQHGIPRGRSHAPAKERGGRFVAEENLRTNDGTSSGALASDRLRMARKKALEGMATSPTAATAVEAQRSTSGGRSDVPPKDRGSSFLAEEQLRSNDGTSSGAVASERLRAARHQALEGASTPIRAPARASARGRPTPALAPGRAGSATAHSRLARRLQKAKRDMLDMARRRALADKRRMDRAALADKRRVDRARSK